MTVKFVNEIEEFVSETSLSSWWNRGVSRYSLPKFCFLTKHDINSSKRFVIPND